MNLSRTLGFWSLKTFIRLQVTIATVSPSVISPQSRREVENGVDLPDDFAPVKKFRFMVNLLWLTVAVFFWLPADISAQTVITNGVQKYASLTGVTVTMSNRCELWVTNATTPLSGCTINLNSTDAWLMLPGLKPTVASSSTYLSQIFINGVAAVVNSNCRVAEYGMGAVVIPYPSTIQPLTVYSQPYFTGAATNLGTYTYYTTALNGNISSFKLKRGYAVTLAQNASGSAYSKCYVAADGDLEVSVLPSTLDGSVNFIYVTAWRWTSKKGIAGNPGNSLLNVQWWYDWNLDQNSTRDFEYVPIRQQRWWPSLSQNWSSRGANTVLGYNEPDNTTQANIAVGDAIWSWPDLLGTGLRVGAPAVTDGGWSWITNFVAQADTAGLRIDFVPLHYYWCYNPSDPNGAATQMYNFLKARYDQLKRPLWITEWNNGANWTGCGDPNYTQQQAAVAAMINMLDTTPFVERYSIYNWVENVRSVVDTNGNISAAGVTYSNQISPVGYVQSLPDNGTRSFTQLRFETNVWDTSGFGNNGVTAGCPTYTNGHSGQALVFDGANTTVTLPPNLGYATSFTFAAWVKWNGGANWQRIFDFGNSTTHYLFLTPNNGSVMRFAIANGGSEQRVDAPALPPNSWQHIAVTLSGSTAKIYTNGVLAAQNTAMSITPANFAPRVNRLGKSQFLTDPLFGGAMDEVLITDYALTATQIARLQTNNPPQFTNSVIARGGGTEGVNYSGTLAGAATDVDPGDTLTYSKTAGPAWLSVASSGALSGTPTSGDGGTNIFTVRVTDAAGMNGFSVLTIPVAVLTANGTWTADASTNWSQTSAWSGNIVASGTNQTADFSTINITADRTVTLDTSRTIGKLKFGDASGTQNWILAASNGCSLKLDTASATSPLFTVTNTATVSAPLAGTNGFTKTGPGTLILNGNNPLTGTLFVDTSATSGSDGIMRIAGPSALGSISTISIRNNNSGTSTLQFDGTLGGIDTTATIQLNGRNNSVLPIENITGTNSLGSLSINVGGGNYLIQSDAGLLNWNGTMSSVATGTRTLTFQGNGDHVVSGYITEGSAAMMNVIKTGNGTLRLGGPNNYIGTTTVSAGKIFVNGILGTNTLSLASGTTLGGNGIVQTAVTVPSNVTLAPGDSLGTLTVSNLVTLQSGSTMQIEINKDVSTNDSLICSSTLTLAGTLIVTNVGGTYLTAGDIFTIFSAPNILGNFSTVKLPVLGTGLVWNTNNLHSGVIAIAATAAPHFCGLNQTADGNFHFSGTGAAGVTYELDSATNLLPPIPWAFVTNAVADQTGFFELWDLSATNAPQRFYRITSPY
jgi:autotransporter-associated beta strand protein